MRVIAGKHVRSMDAEEFSSWASSYGAVTIDLGTGDGRFVRDLAGQRPDVGVIGVDLCAANMRHASRTAGSNALFVAADALTLPVELHQASSGIAIQFPWGSLLHGLLAGDPGLLVGLLAISRPGATLEIVVNAGALAEVGWTLTDGRARIETVLREAGTTAMATAELGPAELRRCPTSWARRLAFGRYPRACRLTGWLDPAELAARASGPNHFGKAIHA